MYLFRVYRALQILFLKANVENIKIEYDLSRRSDIRFSSETLISRLHVNAAPVVSEPFSITKIPEIIACRVEFHPWEC